MSAVKKTWRVEGMHCPHCAEAIERALRGVDGLSQIEVNYAKGTLTALWEEQAVPEAELNARLAPLGYRLCAGRGRWGKGLLAAAAAAGLYLLLTRSPAAAWMAAFPVAREGMSLGALFVVGLMTSLHCVAMCGGVNLAQSAQAARRSAQPWKSSLSYNLGRVASYTAIGALAGGLGQSVSVSAQAKGAIQIAAAALMLIMALKLLDGFEWLRRFSLTRFFPKRRFTPRSSFGVGLANGLMPCGPLQSMQLYALASGSWLRGAAAMLCFSLGTTPLMLGVGVLSGRLNRRFAKPVRLASAALVILMSLSMLTSGLALAGVGGAAVESAPDGVAVVRDGKQTVRTELDYGSYPAITVQAGIPVEWTIHADAEKLNGCNNEIVIPAYGLSVALEPGDNLVTFTPEKAGTVPYSCWMGMIRSGINVVDSE